MPPLIGPYAHVLMPFRDKWGNDLYLDMSYILPYGTAAEKWGQSILPFRDILPNNPLFQLSAAIATNRDPFSGKDVANLVLDGTAKVMGKYLEYAWREMAPSMAPGGYGFNKIKTGIQNIFKDKPVLDWADRPQELQTALLSSIFGIKLSPANERKLKEYELKTRRMISREVYKEVGRLRKRYERNEIELDEFREKARDLEELRRKLLGRRSD